MTNKFTKTAINVLTSRYLIKNEKGENIETIDEMFHRVAHTIAKADVDCKTSTEVSALEKDFYNMIINFDFLPNSPTLMNAGKPEGQLSACFVLPIEDSIEGIFDTIKHAALIHKSGGGTGFAFSRIRPKGDVVKTTGGVASGPVSFMKVFDAATEAIKQGGCFIGSTLIATFDGAIPIKDLKKNTKVYTYDKETGEFTMRNCSEPWVTIKNAEVWKIVTKRGLEIFATSNHPFLVDGEYVQVKDLKVGSHLTSFNEKELNCIGEEDEIVSVEFSHKEDVYNVEIEDTHNYVVCNQDMSIGVVVSNSRRGANMGVLRVDHPDIMEFIHCKQEQNAITNFNISVGITDEFMKAYEERTTYNLINPATKEVVGKLNAREVFDELVNCAYNTGDPGILFLDVINKYNPIYGTEFEATNPCGEQMLLPFESCNLGSVNLSNFVEDGEINYERLDETVRLAIRFLDNVIEANCYPLEEIDKTTKAGRKIGLGVMGFADMLLKLGIVYGSKESLALARNIMKRIKDTASKASEELGAIRGTFPMIYQSTLENTTRRNATVTTIAPTGTLSIIAGCSSGIEPIFSYGFIRRIMDEEFIELNPILKEKLEELGIYSDELANKIIYEGSLHNIEEIPDSIKKVFVSTHDITPEEHIEMQAAFQENVENAVSKTINLPHTATRDDVKEAYYLAYKRGCKGITIYVDGSKDSQVLNIGKTDVKKEHHEHECSCGGNCKHHSISPKDRSSIMHGFTEQVKIGCGKLYVTINSDEEGISEVFTNTGKHGGCPSQSEAVGRLASLALRCGVEIDEIIKQLKGIRCPSTLRQKGLNVLSCPDAIAKSLMKAKEMNKINTVTVHEPEASHTETTVNNENDPSICPICGSKLAHEGGCNLCYNCTYSKCSG